MEALKCKHIKRLREMDPHEQVLEQLRMRTGVERDVIVEEWSPEKFSAETLKMYAEQNRERARMVLSATADFWRVSDPETGVCYEIRRPRSIYDYLAPDLTGWAYERMVIMRLTGLSPEELDEVPLAHHEVIVECCFAEVPSLAAKRWF